MREDGEFAGWVAARWPVLVRSLVLLGCPPHRAEDAARTGLSRCYPAWRRVRRADDVDVFAYRAVLDAWRRACRTWEEPPPAIGEPGDEPGAPARALLPQLDGLTPDLRAVLVLRFVAELSEFQVAEVLDLPVDAVEQRAPAPAEAVLREAGESLPVGPPPVQAIVAGARSRRRRRQAVAGWAAVAVVGVGSLTSWVASLPPAGGEPLTGVVVRAENPLGLAWYANGTLRLAHVAVEIPGVTSLVGVGDAAVYGDRSGAVVLVAPDGALTRIGSAAPGAPLVAGGAWVAWVDPGDRAPELVVYDTDRGTVVARRELPSEGSRWDPADETGHPIAIDQEKVYYAAQDGDHVWEVSGGEPQPVDPLPLLDVASAIRVLAAGSHTIRIVQPLFNVALDRPGGAAQLSSDGNHVLTRTFPGGATANPFGTVRIYDTRSGDRLRTGLGAGDVALSAVLGPDATVTYIVARAADAPRGEMYIRLSFAGPLELRTCRLDAPPTLETTRCRNLGQVPRTGSAPLLAG